MFYDHMIMIDFGTAKMPYTRHFQKSVKCGPQTKTVWSSNSQLSLCKDNEILMRAECPNLRLPICQINVLKWPSVFGEPPLKLFKGLTILLLIVQSYFGSCV